jgi:hypothetical protein
MRKASGHFRFFSENAMKEMFYSEQNIFKEEGYTQYARHNCLNEITTTTRVNV